MSHHEYDLEERYRDWVAEGRQSPDSWVITVPDDYELRVGAVRVATIRGFNGSQYDERRGTMIHGVPVLRYYDANGALLGEFDNGAPCPPFCD